MDAATRPCGRGGVSIRGRKLKSHISCEVLDGNVPVPDWVVNQAADMAVGGAGAVVQMPSDVCERIGRSFGITIALAKRRGQIEAWHVERMPVELPRPILLGLAADLAAKDVAHSWGYRWESRRHCLHYTHLVAWCLSCLNWFPRNKDGVLVTPPVQDRRAAHGPPVLTILCSLARIRHWTRTFARCCEAQTAACPF